MFRHSFVMATCIVAIAIGFASRASAEIRYRFRGLGCNPDTGCVSTIAAGINDLGQVTGRQATAYGNKTFLWDPASGWTTIASTSCGVPYANDINNLGHIGGSASTMQPSGSCFGQPAIWTSDGIMGMGFLPNAPQGGVCYVINNLDQGAGQVSAQNGEAHAFFWSAETGMVDIGKLPGGLNTSIGYGMNDLGWVAGDTDSAAGVQAFVWTLDAGMVALGDLWGYYPPYVGSTGQDVNNLGELVGYAYSPNGGFHGVEAFIWDADNGMRGLGILFNCISQAHYNNDQSEVTGLSCKYVQSRHENYGFIWDPKRGMRQLDALFDPCIGTAYTHFYPQGMNNHGQIVGYAWNFTQPIVLTPYVPGDLNNDNTVDLTDLTQMLLNYGAPAGLYAHGDLNCDQRVDLTDLGWLLSNFGETYP